MGQLGRARLATALIFFLCGISHGTWAPRLAEIKQQTAVSDSQLGIALLLLGFGALIAMPLAGASSVRFGSRSVSIAAALAHALVLPLMAFAESWLALGLAMLLYGTAIASLDVAMNVQATEIEQRMGRPIMSSFHGCYSVGDMAGALATGAAATVFLGLVPHFLLAAAVLLVAGVGACWYMIEDASSGEGRSAFALPRGILLVLGVIAFAALMAEGSVGDWSAIYLNEHQGADTTTAAAALTVFALSMAIMRFAGDRLVARFGHFVMLASMGLIAAAGLALSLLAGNAATAIAGYGIAGIGMAVLFPVTLSAAARAGGGSAGSAIAAVATMGYGGFLIGPPVIGFVADGVGLPLALTIVVLLAAAIPFLALMTRRAGANEKLARPKESM